MAFNHSSLKERMLLHCEHTHIQAVKGQVDEKITELVHGLDQCRSSYLYQKLRLQLLERATYNGDDSAVMKGQVDKKITELVHGLDQCNSSYLDQELRLQLNSRESNLQWCPSVED